jgi:hypothetical protein
MDINNYWDLGEPLRENPFPDAMLLDELSLLKTNDKVEMKGKLSGIYTFISMKNDEVKLRDDRFNFLSSYYLEDVGVIPYEVSKLWNGSNYIVSNKKKE